MPGMFPWVAEATCRAGRRGWKEREPGGSRRAGEAGKASLLRARGPTGKRMCLFLYKDVGSCYAGSQVQNLAGVTFIALDISLPSGFLHPQANFMVRLS